MSQKLPKKAPTSPKFCADWRATATNQEQAISLATWLKTRFRGHLVHPQPPTFCGFHASKLPKWTPRTPVPRPTRLRQAASSSPNRWVPKWVNMVQWGRKMTFLKNDPRPCVMLKQVFLDCFELVVAHFGPPKIPKCLEDALFWAQKWVENGSKTHFSKTHPTPFGVHKRVK